MQRGRRIHQKHISRNVDAPYMNIKAFKALVYVGIPKKGTPCETELKFIKIIGAEIRPTGAPKTQKLE
jgi:hypothetical protein